MIEEFLKDFTGDKEKVEKTVTRLINYLKSTEGKITESFVNSLLDMIESDKCIENLKVYEYFESNFNEISKQLEKDMPSIKIDPNDKNFDRLNLEIIPNQNKWLGDCLEKLKIIRKELKSRDKSI